MYRRKRFRGKGTRGRTRGRGRSKRIHSYGSSRGGIRL